MAKYFFLFSGSCRCFGVAVLQSAAHYRVAARNILPAWPRGLLLPALASLSIYLT